MSIAASRVFAGDEGSGRLVAGVEGGAEPRDSGPVLADRSPGINFVASW
jgi:hypothetical protein